MTRQMTDVSNLMTIGEIERVAAEKLTKDLYDYCAGGAGTEATVRRNREAYERLWFSPRIALNIEERSTATTFLGVPLAVPVMTAPVGSVALFDPDGALACARATHARGTAPMIGILSKPSLEEIAKQTNGPLFFQLYVRGDRDWVSDIVGRVEDSGYKGLCITLDSDVEPRRERMIVNRFSRREAHGPSPNVGSAPDARSHALRWDWKDLEWLRERTELPLIMKGIMNPEDAQRAVDLGAEAIYVSNHGGRGLDYAPSSLEMLEPIVDVVHGRAEVVLDGGVRHGSDVVKAIALGAKAVLIGRLHCWAIAAGGQAGLERCLELLQEEMSIAMGLLGVTDVSSINKGLLRRLQW